MPEVRARPVTKPAMIGNYFAAPKTDIQFIPTGCKTLDLALGGGWAEAKVINIVGDRSTGKTLLAIEAAANFARKYPNGKIRYRESERAFQKLYAQALGLPLDRIDFGDDNSQWHTVEDMHNELEWRTRNAQYPELVICDSLDALSSNAELGRSIDTDTYAGERAKKMSEMLRRLIGPLADSNTTLMIISQERDKINATFGRKSTRAGGRALDFYSSQVLWLALMMHKVAKTVSGIKRTIGINIRAKVEKNKVGSPFLEAEFPILFGYGIDDIESSINYLKATNTKLPTGLLKELVWRKALRDGNEELIAELSRTVEDRFWTIERSFLPIRRKYQ